MTSPVSTIVSTAAPVAENEEAPAPQDGWRTGGLPALRAELDRIDDSLHDLLMQRAEIVEHVARSGKPAAFRPGREASIIRRLLGRHRGALPPVALVRIWRELLAGTTSMQGGFALAVSDGSHGTLITQLAREHFGALTPLYCYASPGQALIDVTQGIASVAILPYPSETDSWWIALLHHEPRLHVIGALPFWNARPDGAPNARAVVVASTPADSSGQDRSFLGLECDSEVSRTRLSGELARLALQPLTLTVVRQQGSAAANVLIEVDGMLGEDDARLAHLGSVLRQPVVLGSYAIPIAGNMR
jgi:chorismate mutase / prephenate dehydratase